jgi:hypothetical protein
MTDQHTPGPWGDDRKPVVVRGLTWVAHANYPTITGEANARLIAAAPDMLEALEDLLNYVGGWDAPADHPCGRARAAIAKARGTQ